MKKPIVLVGLGLGLALSLSLGILMVAQGSAVASTTVSTKITPAMIIHKSSFSYTVACPSESISGGRIATYPWWTLAGYSSTCTYTTSGSYRTIPTLVGWKFVIGPLYMYTNSSGQLIVTDGQIVLTYGSTRKCTITMTKTLVLHTTDGIYLDFGEKTVATSGDATVSPTTGVCATVTSLLATSGTKLTITLNFTAVIPH
jgi:hypothetical protein